MTGLVDAEGNIAATYDYDAFGNILTETGNADNSIKYAGYQHDGESGLYYLNARYYDSTIARFITEDSYRGQRNDPLSLNVYTYCQNNPIRYTDPTGHYSAEVHEDMTREVAAQECINYINEEGWKIKVYKYIKGYRVLDSSATRDARNKWIADQEMKIDYYVDALVAGDKYVDQEKTIYTRKDFYYDGIFHGLNGDKLTQDNLDKKNNPYNFINERKNTAIAILTNDKYTNKGAIQTYIAGPAITMLKDMTNASKKDPVSMTAIKNDLKDKTVIKKVGNKTIKETVNVYEDAKAYDTATKYMAEKETASLFVLGIGLHSLQDVEAHGMETSAHSSSAPNDDPTIDSWHYDNKGNLVTIQGTDRIDNTEKNTRDYIHNFLYGDGTDDNPGYANYLFTPYSPTISKK